MKQKDTDTTQMLGNLQWDCDKMEQPTSESEKFQFQSREKKSNILQLCIFVLTN